MSLTLLVRMFRLIHWMLAIRKKILCAAAARKIHSYVLGLSLLVQIFYVAEPRMAF